MMAGNKKVVIGFSGGMDSTTLLAYYLDKGYSVHCCHFQYGSKHNAYELKAVKEIQSYYIWAHNHESVEGSCMVRGFDIRAIYQGIDSNLLMSGGRIPEGHYEDESMKATKVPGRNLILLSIMASYAEHIKAGTIAIGVHAGDREIYPDCRESFITYAGEAIRKSTDGLVSKVEAPFIDLKKEGILKLAMNEFKKEVPFYLTRTCYKDQPVACGKCGSCQERLEAFKLIGIPDPITYE